MRHDWNRHKLLAIARWANRRIWRSIPFENYQHHFKAPIHPANQIRLPLPPSSNEPCVHAACPLHTPR